MQSLRSHAISHPLFGPAALHGWGLRLSQRTTLSEQQVRNRRGKSERLGILIGVWDERELPDELWSKYLGEDK